MVEAEIETEEDENAGGDGFGEAAVEIHRLVDPVTVSQVPDEAAGVTESRSLAEGKWISCLSVTEKRPEKGKKSDPAEGGSPERRRALRWGKGESGGCRRVRPWPKGAGE